MVLEKSFTDTLNCQINSWVLQKVKPQLSLEAKLSKLKLSYLEHIMRRQDILENIVMLS